MNESQETPSTNTSPTTVVALYAGFWIRVVAYIIDSIITAILGFIVGFVIGIAGNSLDPQAMQSVSAGIGIIIGILYFVGMEASDNQATLGKMAMGLKVTDLHGHKITYGRAFGRYLGKFLSGILLGIGYIMVAFTEKKQGLHDMLAGTLVVKK